MAITEFVFTPGTILQPAIVSPLNVLEPIKLGASLNLTRGQCLGRKTSDNFFYPLNPIASDGTQVFGAIIQYSCSTDANNLVYGNYGSGGGVDSWFSPPQQYGNAFTGGIFDPRDILTAPSSGTPTAEVDTITPTNPTTGDTYSVFNAAGQGVEIVVGSTQTATATVTLLAAAWNADPALTAIATTSGTATFILTAVTKGEPLGLKATAVGTGTVALVITTAAVSAVQAEVDTFTLAGTINTGDVYTATITYGGGQTFAVTATVGGTTTPTAVDALLLAAWNNTPQTANYATPSGTATFILTSAVVGSAMNVAVTSSGAGTITKVVTKAAFGQNLADLLSGCPGARVLQPNGYWELP